MNAIPGGPTMQQDLLPTLEGTTLSGRRIYFPQDLPASGLILVIGFTHDARHDVGAWKFALAGRGVPFLSLPTAAVDTLAEQLEGVARAMRKHVPSPAWDQVVQIHSGGEALRRVYSWQVDVFAKVLRVTGEGEVLARHDEGPFSDAAAAAILG
jgi:hypothetical protein